jgi:hypothetical protein
MKRIINKKQLDELVGGDIFSDGGDRNQVKDKEIETGPVDKPFNDSSSNNCIYILSSLLLS